MHTDNTLEVTAKYNNENDTHRPAKEVFLFMHPTVRISRNIRALWFFDHLHKKIKIGPDPYERSSQIEVVGIVPEEGSESFTDEEFLITENTLVTYMSHLYRLVFILDMSPSTFVVESNGSVLQLRVMASLRRSLENVTKEFRYPGSSRNQRPKFYISICVFSPFIAVAGDHVLLQGVLLDSENLESVMKTVSEKLDHFLANLWKSANNQLCTWNNERRRMRFNGDGLATLVYNESAECDSRGFVQPEWALVFMLRMGLLGVQMLPENTQSNIIVITDGVVGMPNAQAMAQLLTQLRSFTVSCSFIQLTPPLADDTVFGNFSSPELLQFLAMATFGTYIYDQGSIPESAPLQLNVFHRAFLCWSFQRALASNDFIYDLVNTINPEFASLSNRDIVKRVYKKNMHTTSLENLLYVRLREGYTVRRVQIYTERTPTGMPNSDVEYCEHEEEKEATYLLVELRLPWKPLVFISYDIRLPWTSSSSSSKRENVRIEVCLEAPFHLLKDFLSSEKFASEQRQNSVDALKSSMYSVIQADRLLLHIHRFNSDPQYYTIPGEVTEAFALFTCAGTVSDQSIAVSRDMEMRNKKFVDFWYLVCGMDEGIWQKWVHTHTTRMILSPDEPLPSRLFTGKTQLSVRTSFTKLHDLLRELTSFTLVQFQSYIKFVYGPENTKVPKYFYIVRTSQEGPCVILKIAFLGGIGAPDRKRVEGELKRQLTTMAIPKDLHYTSTNKFPEFKKAYERSKSQSYSITKREQPAVTIITKPLERILIRYKDFPKNYDGVVRLEDDTHDAHIKDIVLHNSVANYLVCRRRIWCIPKIFKKAEPMSFEAAEYILYMILQRHLHHGFKIAHSENGVFTLCRQSPQQTIEQFVIFPPAASMNGYKGPENGGSGNAEAYHHSECEMFLITEMWSEPDSSLESDEEALYNMSTKRVENDVDIIAVLATFDQLTRACETHLKSCVIFGLPTCKERKPFDHLNYSVAMSHSTFDLCILVKNSTEKHLLLFPAIGFDDSDPKSRQRLGNLLHCLHCEMTSVSDVCLDIKDGSAWYDMVDDLDYAFDDTESKRSKQDREKNVAFKNMRVYASRISPWRLIVVVMLVGIDDVLEVTSTENPAVPVLVFHLDEPMMAKKIALCENESPVKWHIDDFRNRKENILAMLNQQIQENKNSCESAIEYCWFQKSRVPEEQGIFNTLFCFSSYCDIIEEKVFSRAFVAAVFCSLTDEVYVPEDVFREAMEDRSDHTSISIAGISRIQSAVCTHMDLFHENFDYGCDEDASSQLTAQTCGESLLNIDYLMQRYNFKPVPNMPTYFFYCPNLDPERDDIVLHTMTIEAVDTADISPMSEDESQAEEEEAESPIEQAAPSVINESVNSEHDSEEFAPCDEDIQSNHSNNADDEHLEDEEDEQQSSKEEEKEESAESSEEPLSDRSSFAYANDLDVTSELSHRDIDEYWQSYLDFCPLFVQFSCTVKSLEGSIVNFPLSRLPYCLMECFDKRRSSEMFGSEITIDMYVLTWTSPLSTISAQYFEDVQRDNNSYDYNKMYSSQFSFRMDDDVLERSNYAKSGLLDDLPHRESSTILQLQSGLENLMESERLLFLSRMRSENATKGNINDIVEFVKGARDAFLDDFEMLSPNCQPFVSISYNEYNCKFVIDWAEGVTRLAGLLDGHIICANSYVLSALPRRKKENRLYLYCDSVDSPSPASTKHEHHHHHCHQFFDCDRQDEWIGVDQEQQSSGNSMSECHQMNDFWLVVKAEKKTNKIGVYLCQRHSMVNDAAFEELCAFIRKSVRQTNQEILLERLQKTFTCDSLLVAPSSREEPNEKLDSLSSEDDFGPSLPELDPHRFVNFRTGHFACDNVWNHWFEIHPRLMGARSTGELTDMMGTLPIEKIAETTWARPTGEAAENTIYAPAALFALTMGLQQLAVRNRKNLFVFLDDSGHRYYLRLHCSKESYFDTCSTPRSKEWLNENISRFNSSILLSCYGVNEPNEQLTVCLRDVLQKRLDQSVMEDIVSSLAKNKQAQLNVTDVNFIQPERSDPFTTVYFTIPKLIDDFLGSYAFFLKQLLLTFSVTPRIRERSGSSRKSSSASSAFMPFLTQSSKAEFTGIQDSSAFFLVVRPHASGSRNMGIALLDVSFVRPDGNPHDLPRPPNISLSITRRIYPATNSSYGTGSRGRAVANLSQELTKTRTVASLSEMKFTDANVLVQCAIWQVGDVGLEELQEKVRVSVQQALCDVVTEYGLLSSILFDSSHTPFSPGYRSTDGQRVTSEAQRHHSSDQNHHSTSVQNLPKRSSSGSTSPANLGSGQLQCAPTPSMFPFNGPVHSHSQPSTHPPSVCGDSEYRASDGEDADRILSNGMSKISVAKLQQKNSIEQHRRRASGAPAPIDCLQINFVISMAEWFDHVVKELSKLTTVCKSVRKKEFLLDCDIAASKLTQVIYREVSKVIPRDSLTIYQTYDTDQLKSGKRFQPVSPEDIATKEYQDTGRVLSHVNETIDIVLVGHEKTHFNLRELHSPLSMSDSVRHSECWSTEAYQMHKPDTISNIPRQRLLYLIISGETLTLYMYNYIDELVSKVQRVVDTAVSWINARSWLLRGIGQQKMGICHLNSIKKSELNPNPYMPLTWMNPQLLVECDYPKPQMINFAVHKDISHEKAQIYFRIYRNSEHIFVPTNLNKDSIFFDQTAQMLGMRSDLLTDIETRERLVGVHRDLFSSETSVMKDEIFQEFITRSHNVHFVETPILLLKSWRLRIGEIRAAGHVSHVFSKRKMSFARSTISSVSAGTKSGSLTSSPPKRRTDEEPAMYRIQYMLLKDYVEYLKPFGFRILKVQGGAETKTCCELVDDKIVFNSDVAVSPDFWMYMPIEHGIIFAQLTFFKPYFCVHFHLWNSLTGKSSTDDAAYSDDEMSEQDEEDDEARLSLEHVKNLVISKSHVHSFTYDFHLRTIGTYLMGNDHHGIFDIGFDAEGFLADFLKYYEGRPPNARNCVYEDQVKYEELKVSRSEISDFFLNEKLAEDQWRIMKLRARSVPNSDCYMLISKEKKEFGGENYDKIRVVILDRSQEHRDRQTDNINLKFYVVLLAESVMSDVCLEDSAELQIGEFKTLDSFPEEEDDEFGTDDDMFSSRGDDIMSTSVYEPPDNSQLPVRRRFCSGDTALMNARRKKISLVRRRTSTDTQGLPQSLRGSAENMTLSDSDLTIAGKRHAVDFMNSDIKPSSSKLSIVKNPPRRHRHNRHDLERHSIVAREKITYIHYISPRQQLVQAFLEDNVSDCKRELQKWLGDAEWYCRRDKLWNALFSSTTEHARTLTNTIVAQGRLDLALAREENRPTVRQVTNSEMPSNDFETLLNITTKETLTGGEVPDLCTLLNKADHSNIFKYVVEYFGDRRCRYFDHSKKCLLIIDPNNVQTFAVLIRYDPRKHILELLTMYKDRDMVTTAYAEKFKNDEMTLIHEVSTCLMSYIWADLLHSPLPTGPKRGHKSS